MRPEMCLIHPEDAPNNVSVALIVLDVEVGIGVRDFEYAPEYNSFGDFLEEQAHEELKAWEPVDFDIDLPQAIIKLREYEPMRVDGDLTIFRARLEVTY